MPACCYPPGKPSLPGDGDGQDLACGGGGDQDVQGGTRLAAPAWALLSTTSGGW